MIDGRRMSGGVPAGPPARAGARGSPDPGHALCCLRSVLAWLPAPWDKVADTPSSGPACLCPVEEEGPGWGPAGWSQGGFLTDGGIESQWNSVTEQRRQLRNYQTQNILLQRNDDALTTHCLLGNNRCQKIETPRSPGGKDASSERYSVTL